MPELTCPNPECKGDLKPHVERCLGGGGYAVVCPACDMSGPYADTEAEAIRLFLLLGTAGEYRALAEKLAVAVASLKDGLDEYWVTLSEGIASVANANRAIADAREAGVLPVEGAQHGL